MNKIAIKILALILLFCCHSVNAQKKFYSRLDVATQATTDWFNGAAAGVNTGISVKGIEVGLELGFYSQKWNDKRHFLSISGNGELHHSELNRNRDLAVSVDACFGYDVLHFIKSAKSHHLTPFTSVGYSLQSLFYTYGNANSNDIQISNEYQGGFDWSFGCRYEYDITNHFSAGIFWRVYALNINKDFLGISLKYSLPLN